MSEVRGLVMVLRVRRCAAEWRRGSFGYLDLVFFHGVAWPLESRVEPVFLAGPYYVTRGGRWKLERDGVTRNEHWVSGSGQVGW